MMNEAILKNGYIGIKLNAETMLDVYRRQLELAKCPPKRIDTIGIDISAALKDPAACRWLWCVRSDAGDDGYLQQFAEAEEFPQYFLAAAKCVEIVADLRRFSLAMVVLAGEDAPTLIEFGPAERFPEMAKKLLAKSFVEKVWQLSPFAVEPDVEEFYGFNRVAPTDLGNGFYDDYSFLAEVAKFQSDNLTKFILVGVLAR